MHKLEFRNVCLAFGPHVILKHFNLQVAPGELLMILGQSGSGKSTILKLALGLLKPDAGEIYLDGVEITSLRESELIETRRHLSMVFQGGALFDSLSVFDNIAYRPRESGWTAEEIERRVHQVLELIGLPLFAQAYPDTLSGGQKRLVAVARAIVDQPGTIFFDEPTAGLDPITARRMCDTIIRLRDQQRVTMLLVTHKLDNVRYVASHAMPEHRNEVIHRENEPNTRLLVLRQGRAAFTGPVAELWQATDDYLRDFTAMTSWSDATLAVTND
jgi:phospholipid/cholesterol/gamma-HCH transport system ATP-binding protein